MAKIKKITPLLFLFSGLIAAFYFDFDKYVDFQFLQTHQGIVKGFITDMPVQAALLYMSLYAVSTVFSLPFGTIMTISGGLAIRRLDWRHSHGYRSDNWCLHSFFGGAVCVS